MLDNIYYTMHKSFCVCMHIKKYHPHIWKIRCYFYVIKINGKITFSSMYEKKNLFFPCAHWTNWIIRIRTHFPGAKYFYFNTLISNLIKVFRTIIRWRRAKWPQSRCALFATWTKENCCFSLAINTVSFLGVSKTYLTHFQKKGVQIHVIHTHTPCRRVHHKDADYYKRMCVCISRFNARVLIKCNKINNWKKKPPQVNNNSILRNRCNKASA